MSTVSSEADPLLTPRQDHRWLSCCCKLSYKPRKFSSKGAVLVLVWQLIAVSAFPNQLLSVHVVNDDKVETILSFITILAGLVTSISVGWLADVRFGRLKVVKAGLLLMWLGKLISNVNNTMINAFPNEYTPVSKYIQFLGTLGTNVGAIAFFINILQFGLEQMPDSSSIGITAFVSWFIIASLIGLWLHEENYRNFKYCTSNTIYSLIPLCISFTFMSIAVCSMFLFSHWLIDHRQKHNPLKTVYQVLKFAKQHKYPVQRSAFTYWEEDIPSRIDLGKTKYGGPFTTEEVEDVKTFFRILVVLAAVISLLAVTIEQLAPGLTNRTCKTKNIDNSTYGIAAGVCLLYEVLLYPVMRCRLSMLRRIGCCVFCGVLISLVLLAFYMESVLGPIDGNYFIINHSWIFNISVVFFLFLGYALFTSLSEFIYSQSPERMKGFLIGSFLCAVQITLFIIGLLSSLLKKRCSHSKYCSIYTASVVTVFSVVVFVFYCCVARWYKWRERDEPCNERAIIEEIYGRHVEHNSIEETNTT